jgi:RNA polymerase sigma-70 factor (ECF subfamily)
MQIDSSSDKCLEDLWLEVLGDNPNALQLIHRELFSRLYQYSTNLLTDDLQADDAVQEIFIKAWIQRKKIGPLKNLNAYFFTLMRRYCLNVIRNKKVADRRLIRFQKTEPVITFSAEDILVEKEVANGVREKINDLLNGLPPRQKEVIYLKYFNDMNNAEIAEVLEIQYQSVVNLSHKAITYLKANLKFRSLILLAMTFGYGGQ